MLLLKEHEAIFSVGAVHRDEYPSYLPALGMIPSSEMHTKQLTALVFQGAMLPIIEWLGATNIVLWVDYDKTKVPWFGKVMRMDRHYRAIIPGSDQFIEPQNLGMTLPLLEAADLFAYICSHSLSPEHYRQQERFDAIYRCCRPILAPLTFDPEKRKKGEIPISILQTKHAVVCGDSSYTNAIEKEFHRLPVGASTWMQGYDKDGKSYVCVFMKMPTGQAKRAMTSGEVDFKAGVQVIGTIPIPCVLFRFTEDSTVYVTFLHDSNPLIQLLRGKELRLILFEDDPKPVGEIHYSQIEVTHWKRLLAEVEKFPMYTDADLISRT